ncbi:MAG: M15 family metallopeptidase [Clostridiales Family XIII bacterium]|jgi:D-alanyl-D-alanine carboxypeptidase|nr:M15 family metallopeptidase [Clostridiales Family XIII bacterium]
MKNRRRQGARIRPFRLFCSLLILFVIVFIGIRSFQWISTSDSATRKDATTPGSQQSGGVPVDSGSGPSDIPEEKNNESTGDNAAYSDFYYYEKDKDARYAEYASPGGILPGDVVWRVNAGLDGVVYHDVQDVSNPYELTVIVNKYNKLKESYVPPDLKSIGNVKVRAEAADAYVKMATAAAIDGIFFIPQSGYRSYSYQDQLYTNYKATDPNGADTYSARPGFSEHQTGLAIDLNIPSGGSLRNFTGTPQAKWVEEHAHEFGFIIRYTDKNTDITGYISEPWHIRFLGIEHATNMKKFGIDSYEEYKVKYIDHKEGENTES